MKLKMIRLWAALCAFIACAAPLTACARPTENSADENIYCQMPAVPEPQLPEQSEPKPPEPPEQSEPQGREPNQMPVPEVREAAYILVNADGLNIRSGAGINYDIRGRAQKGTLYALEGSSDGWYRTSYKNAAGYVSGKYCTTVHMPLSADERVERVVEEGLKLLGVPYVYGAPRCHDGKGVKNPEFTPDKFDCSSLIQYIFFKGAGELLDVTTRTQIAQGKTIAYDDIGRGDLLFFTNASRKNLSGVERVGHVALYLGEGYILHTASDFAKIEKISSARRANFIQAQRIF